MGGGHTHAIVLRKLGMQPLSGVRLTLITNLVDTPYSGMLPCHISGLYDFDASHIDLRPLSRFANCQLMMDRAVASDGATSSRGRASGAVPSACRWATATVGCCSTSTAASTAS